MYEIELLPSTFIGSDFVQSSTAVVDTGNMNALVIEWWIQPLPTSPDTVTMTLEHANENNGASFLPTSSAHTFDSSGEAKHVASLAGFGRYLRTNVTVSLSSMKGYTLRGVISLKPSM